MNVLNPHEVAVIGIALQGMIEDLEETSKSPAYNFTPDARKDMKDILRNAISAREKIKTVSGLTLRMDPYVAGDETNFLTKES